MKGTFIVHTVDVNVLENAVDERTTGTRVLISPRRNRSISPGIIGVRANGSEIIEQERHDPIERKDWARHGISRLAVNFHSQIFHIPYSAVRMPKTRAHIVARCACVRASSAGGRTRSTVPSYGRSLAVLA